MAEEKEQALAENYLLSLGKWGIFSVRIPGYFPLSFGSGFRKLSFSIFSLSSLYTVSLLLILTLWDSIFFARKAAFNQYLKAKGPTEVYAYTLILAMSSVLGIYIIVFGLKNRDKFLSFWAGNVGLLQRVFLRLDLPLDVEPDLALYSHRGRSGVSVVSEKTLQAFFAIREKGRLSFLLLIVPVVLHVFIDYGYRIAYYSHFNVNGTTEDVELSVGLGVWTFFSLAGPGISVWMCFFIQFYTACISGILDKLRPDEMQEEVVSQFPFQVQDHKKKLERKRSTLPLASYLALFQGILREIDNFNEFFGTVIIFEISCCVLNLLVYLFFALIWLGRKELGLLAEVVVPIYLYGKELYDMGTRAEEMTEAGLELVKAFGESVALEGLSEETQLKLQILCTQVSTNPPSVSAKAFFVINRSLVTAVLSGLATFLVVLVQFRDADDG